MPKALIFYDYADPLSWLLEARLRPGEVRGKVTPDRFPFPRDWTRVAPEAWAARLDEAARLAAEFGVDGTPDLPPTRSHKAFELTFLAEASGVFLEVHEALFQARFGEGLDIGRIDTLVQVAKSVGLDPGEAKAALDVDTYTAALDEWVGRTERLGFASPPVVIVDGVAFEGVEAVRQMPNPE